MEVIHKEFRLLSNMEKKLITYIHYQVFLNEKLDRIIVKNNLFEKNNTFSFIKDGFSLIGYVSSYPIDKYEHKEKIDFILDNRTCFVAYETAILEDKNSLLENNYELLFKEHISYLARVYNKGIIGVAKNKQMDSFLIENGFKQLNNSIIENEEIDFYFKNL